MTRCAEPNPDSKPKPNPNPKLDVKAPPRERLGLKTVPFSRNTTFGVSDVHELIALLEERPGIICRPSRLNGMFASRACRMSTMIGTSLDKAKMKRLLDHAATLEQPWNCPHGRPTMRHLHDMTELHAQVAQKEAARFISHSKSEGPA